LDGSAAFGSIKLFFNRKRFKLRKAETNEKILKKEENKTNFEPISFK
jgi:hypothetical protein